MEKECSQNTPHPGKVSTDFLSRHSQRVGQDIKILHKLLQFPSGDNMHRYCAYIVMVCKFTIWKSWKYHTNSHTSEPGVPTWCSRKCMYYNQIFHSCNAIAITKYFTQRWVWSRGVTIHFFHKRYILRYLICITIRITIRFIGN